MEILWMFMIFVFLVCNSKHFISCVIFHKRHFDYDDCITDWFCLHLGIKSEVAPLTDPKQTYLSMILTANLFPSRSRYINQTWVNYPRPMYLSDLNWLEKPPKKISFESSFIHLVISFSSSLWKSYDKLLFLKREKPMGFIWELY